MNANKIFVSEFHKKKKCSIAKTIRCNNGLDKQYADCVESLIKPHIFNSIMSKLSNAIHFHIFIHIMYLNNYGVCMSTFYDVDGECTFLTHVKMIVIWEK